MKIRSSRWLFLILFFGCSNRMSLQEMQTGYSLLSEEVKNQIKVVEQSIVGITTNLNYEILTFDYEFKDGQPIPDPTSPIGYKLRAGNGITSKKEDGAIAGGGLIIYKPHDIAEYGILTSSHLVSPRDTVDIYYLDAKGNPTNLIFQRRIIRGKSILVRGDSNWKAAAQLVGYNPVDDIAVLHVKTNNNLGNVYTSELAFDMKPSWGDWVFLFGYPREVKQMTAGWVSESPYRGTFAVDAVVRNGFSGGPVFTLSRKTGSLAFVGIVKSVPSNSFEYIGPDGSLPEGFSLQNVDMSKLVIRKQTLVHYGTAYCVNSARIRTFFRQMRSSMNDAGVWLGPKYFE